MFGVGGTYNVRVGPFDCVAQVERTEHDHGQVDQVDREAQTRQGHEDGVAEEVGEQLGAPSGAGEHDPGDQRGPDGSVNGHVDCRHQGRRIDQAGLVVGAVPEVGQQQGGERERRQENPEEPREMLGQPNVGPLVQQVAGEDAQTVGAHVLVSGEVRVAQLLLD